MHLIRDTAFHSSFILNAALFLRENQLSAYSMCTGDQCRVVTFGIKCTPRINGHATCKQSGESRIANDVSLICDYGSSHILS